MTGFGVAVGEVGVHSIRVEIRSVNHRFLQVKTRLPSDFSFLEPSIDSLLKKKLDRGSVSISVIASRSANAESVTVNADVAARYQELLGKLAKKTGVENDLRLSDLVGLPGVVGGSDEGGDKETHSKAILKLVSEAAVSLIEMRQTEGNALEADLRKNATKAAKTVARIEKRMPKVVREHHKTITKRVDELIGGDKVKVTESDLARELALLAERLDVAEEISRLASHFEQLDAILTKGGAVGRKLDFLVQELQREANTIGSKCNDAQVAHAVVELKTVIERVREQVQNVE